MKKKLLIISMFYLLILAERISSVLSLIAFICSLFCYIYWFDYKIILFQIMTGMLAMCCYKAAAMDETRLDAIIENISRRISTGDSEIRKEGQK